MLQESATQAPTINAADHALFDAHFLRAIAQTGYSRWYLRPKVEQTSITLKDVRLQVQQSIENTIGKLPGKRLIQHLAYNIVANGMDTHLEYKNIDEMLHEIRYSMILVARGEFVLDNKEDPLFQYSRPASRPCNIKGNLESRVVNIIGATHDERKIASSLVGSPNIMDDISMGNLSQIISEGAPHLCALDKGKCADLAFGLRQNLHRFIQGRQEFDDDLRKKCIEEIFHLWDKIQPTEQLRNIVEKAQQEAQGESLEDISEETFINQYIKPVLQDPTLLRERLKALEFCTFTKALLAKEEDCAKISIIWKKVFPYARIALCDVQSNGLAYLAANAGGDSLQQFQDTLGPAPKL